jgi:hypothetical protein
MMSRDDPVSRRLGQAADLVRGAQTPQERLVAKEHQLEVIKELRNEFGDDEFGAFSASDFQRSVERDITNLRRGNS